MHGFGPDITRYSPSGDAQLALKGMRIVCIKNATRHASDICKKKSLDGSLCQHSLECREHAKNAIYDTCDYLHWYMPGSAKLIDTQRCFPACLSHATAQCCCCIDQSCARCNAALAARCPYTVSASEAGAACAAWLLAGACMGCAGCPSPHPRRRAHHEVHQGCAAC